MSIDRIRDALLAHRIRPDAVSIHGSDSTEGQYRLVRHRGVWSVYYWERGERRQLREFPHESDACAYLLDLVLRDPTTRIPGLKMLEGLRLSAVVFVLDYLQLQFDGPTFTALTWPLVTDEQGEISVQTAGYRDRLCEQIGKTVAKAVEDPGELQLGFADGTTFKMSLRDEDRRGPEAAILQDTGLTVQVWR